MNEEKKSFTVKDRRHFTAEGEAREEEPEAPPQEAPRPRAADKGADKVDFSGFVLSLAAQCGMLLSPREGQPHLEEAHQIISILEMLEDKTQGRRTPEEDSLLGQILYELRMTFVELTRGAQ